MLEPQALVLIAMVAGAGTAALLIVALLWLHAMLARLREPQVTHFDVAMLEAELGVAGFDCERWRASGGECCPAGTVAHDCPALAPALDRARRHPL